MGTSAPVARTKTDASGKYMFTRLLPGSYFVHVPASNFASGQPLVGLVSVSGTGSADDNSNEDGIDNATPAINGISCALFTLTDNGEPTNSTESGFANTDDDSDDNNTDLTIDFGFATPPSNDFGDWNGVGAATTSTYNVISASLRLGALSDAENAVVPASRLVRAKARGDTTAKGSAP